MEGGACRPSRIASAQVLHLPAVLLDDLAPLVVATRNALPDEPWWIPWAWVAIALGGGHERRAPAEVLDRMFGVTGQN